MLPKLNILHEDNDILVCIKPAGIPCESDNGRSPDLLNMVKNHLAVSFHKYGNGTTNLRKQNTDIPYAALLHRLDRPVGGVMVFAKNQKAAACLSNDIKAKSQGKSVLFEKEYLAVLAGTEPIFSNKSIESPARHTLHDYIKTDKRSNTSFITSKEDSDGKPATLSYQVLDSRFVVLPSLSDKELSLSLVRIKLKTGRHHQIRLQMKNHLNGIWGDHKYNPLFKSDVDFRKLQTDFSKYAKHTFGKMQSGRITDLALFSSKLTFLHPFTGEELSFETRPDSSVFHFFIES